MSNNSTASSNEEFVRRYLSREMSELGYYSYHIFKNHELRYVHRKIENDLHYYYFLI